MKAFGCDWLVFNKIRGPYNGLNVLSQQSPTPCVTIEKLGVLRNEPLWVLSTNFTIIFSTKSVKLGCLQVESFSVWHVKVYLKTIFFLYNWRDQFQFHCQRRVTFCRRMLKLWNNQRYSFLKGYLSKQHGWCWERLQWKPILL